MFSPFHLLPREKRRSSPRIAGTIVQIILAEQIPLRSNRITRKVAGVKNLRRYLPQDAHLRDLALALLGRRNYSLPQKWTVFHGLRQSGRAEYVGGRPDAVATSLDLCYLSRKSNGLR
jgi:hypothetical protein